MPEDITADLQDLSADPSDIEGPGFTAVLEVEPDHRRQAIYFVETETLRNETIFYGPVTAPCDTDQSLALRLVAQAFGPVQSLPRELVRQVYRPIVSLPEKTLQAKPFRFGPAVPDGEPLTSIIIPFYGDAFFLNCVYHLQRVLGPGFELVLVVDDPRIWPDIYAGLNSRNTSIRIPTVLLQNADNYGFGRANNLGFTVARGDVIVLMNSDIMVMDPAPLVEASAAIRARQKAEEPELIVGFSLLYEDNSIQHIGMEFPRSPLVGNLFLADHPMKGLPFALYEGQAVRAAPAVTGALMALSSSLFQRLGGFDPVYERGDFEDADLCLRARQFGADIVVHVTPGLYHLERQSIPGMGDQALRTAITYMNCVEFNVRWEAYLSDQRRHDDQPQRSLPKKRNVIAVRRRNAVS